MPLWPYPRWIAHRGAGQLAPENTLAAFAVGAAHGWRMFECDVKLSADGVPFLLHDATLERTTNGQGPAGACRWETLARLDAGGWHSPAFAGEPLCRLDALAHWCLAHGHFLNIEIKPTAGQEAVTGDAVARAASRLWQGALVPPLLTSFSVEALAAAQRAVPDLPRGLLIDRLDSGWAGHAQTLGCSALVAWHPLWDEALAHTAQAMGLRRMAYTVNETHEVNRLLGLGLEGIITDRVDLLGHHAVAEFSGAKA